MTQANTFHNISEKQQNISVTFEPHLHPQIVMFPLNQTGKSWCEATAVGATDCNPNPVKVSNGSHPTSD